MSYGYGRGNLPSLPQRPEPAPPTRTIGPVQTIPIGGGLPSYQTGVYTPVLSSSGGGELLSYATQLGYWRRLGDLVWVAANIVLASASGGSGDIQVSLPFPPLDGPTSPLAVYLGAMSATWTGTAIARISTAASAVLIREFAAGADGAAWGKLGSTGVIRVAGWYLAA